MSARVIKRDVKVWLGADPEIFLATASGKIVGSEKAIPEEGLAHHNSFFPNHAKEGPTSVVRDGVQIELNLPATDCREWLGLEIQNAFKKLHLHLEAMKDKPFQVSFRQTIDVDRAELDSLTKMSRRLGCQPSFNYYQPMAKINVDPDTYLKRSAGGHIHLGLPDHLMGDRAKLAPICDALLGNTSVLIDRDPGAAERRLVYGRAGEFRMPRHGFEYRTLSNFWLRSKQLMSLVTGLARLGVYVLHTSVGEGGWAADEALFEHLDLEKVERAINTNDLDLARENYGQVREFIRKHVPTTQEIRLEKTETGLCSSNLDQFDRFIEGIDQGGIEKWFPKDPLDHWLNTSWSGGWEVWLDYNVKPEAAK